MEKTYPVLGHSMRFALEPGDSVLAEPCAPRDLKPGELALLVKWDGARPSYVVHRVLLNAGAGGRRLLLTKGDANLLPDLPPGAFQPVGRALRAGRAGRSWSAAPGRAWPLASAYSFAANKALSCCVFLAYYLLLPAALYLPEFFRPALDALALFWETRAYPALLRLLAAPVRGVPAAGPEAPACRVKSGRISADETWEGEVAVADYAIIAPGVRVTVRPGARVVFVRREPWFFPVLRAGAGRRELESRLAKVLVYGELRAEGSPEAPVFFGGDSFGGLHALGGGAITARHCVLEGAGAGALSAWDRALVSAEDVSFLSCRRGAEVRGAGALSLAKCSFRGTAGPAVLAADDSSALLSRVEAAGCGAPAVELSGRAAAGLFSVSAAGCLAGLSASGEARAELRGCAFSGSGEGAALLSGAASLNASCCAFDGGGFGVAASGRARVNLYSCRLAGGKGLALSAAGRTLAEAVRCEISGNGAGLRLSGAGRLRLRSCRFSANSGPGVELCGHNEFYASGCSFEGGESGVEGLGRNRVRLESCAFAGVSGPGVSLERADGLAARACSFRNCKAGVLLAGTAAFSGSGLLFEGNPGPAFCAEGEGSCLLAGSSFTGNAAGAVLSGPGTARLENCVFERQEGASCSLSGKARARVEAGVFSGGGGLKLSGAAALAAGNCSFTGLPGPAAEASGSSELSLSGCTVSGAGSAAVARGRAAVSLERVRAACSAEPALVCEDRASFHAAGSHLRSGADAVRLAGSGEHRFTRCLLESAGGTALNLRSGSARLDSSALKGRGGVLAGSGRLRLRGIGVEASDFGVDSAAAVEAVSVSVSGGALGGVSLSGRPNRLRDVAVSGAPYPGIAAPRRGLSAAGISYAGRPWHAPRPPARPARFRRLAFSFAAATSGLPLFSSAYRLLYLAAARLAPVLLRVPGLKALFLYRGMTQEGWVPALSDMDLAFVTEELSPAEDYRAYARLRSRLRFFRTLFPFTGETLLCSEKELPSFLGSWGVKGQEFSLSSRALYGGLPLRPAAPAPAPGGDATEAFYSYTLLMRNFFEENAPEAFLRRNCRKTLVDIKRYLDPAADARLSRRAYAAGAGLPLEDYHKADRGESAWLAFTALHAAAAGRAAWRPASAPAAGGWFNRAPFEAACLKMSAEAGLRVGAALDSLYRFYLVLPDEAAEDGAAFLRACAALRSARAASAALGASPLVLTASAFALVAGLPYLNNPMLWADAAAAPSGGGPQDGGVYCFGLQGLPRGPAAPELRSSAVYAARHFCSSWRSLWESMPPHYFYTRTAGLTLLLRRGASPAFSDPERLRAELSRACAVEAPGWQAYLAGGAGRENYEYIAARAAELGRLADEA